MRNNKKEIYIVDKNMKENWINLTLANITQ